MSTLYESIKHLCDEKGIKPGRMCVDLGISKSMMTKLSNGTKKDIQTETAQKIASYFGVSVGYLLGKGPRNDPLYFNRKIFSVMHEQKLTLEVLSEKTGIAVETIRAFALGEKIDNGMDCLEKLAEVLNVSEAYLMGWSGYKEDPAYWGISPEAWEYAEQDPEKAYGLQQFLDDEEYQANMEHEEQRLNKKTPTPEDERIDFDDFTYAMQNETKDLTDMDKQLLLSMARQLNDARKQRNGEPK